VETFITRQHLKRRHDISKKDFIQTCLWKKQLFISLEMSHGIFVAEIRVASVEAVVSLLPWKKKKDVKLSQKFCTKKHQTSSIFIFFDPS